MLECIIGREFIFIMDKIEKETLVSDNCIDKDSHPSSYNSAPIDISKIRKNNPYYNKKDLPPSPEAPFGYTSKGKPRKMPLREDLQKFGEENVEAGDNTRFLRLAMASWDLPPIDISDAQQVENRIYEYFTFCAENDRKPSMVGMANWIGVSKDTVREWKLGNVRNETHAAPVQKALNILEELWVDYMQNGKINPASGIFLAKNMFQYKDVIDIKPVAPDPLGEQVSAKELADKYKDIIEE